MVVREASNVTLVCKAVGYPEPYVMWRREDGRNINYNGESGELTVTYIHIMNNYNNRTHTMSSGGLDRGIISFVRLIPTIN